MHQRTTSLAICVGLLALGACAPNSTGDANPSAGQAPVAVVQEPVLTEQVGSDADDPAIWIHPTDPAKSLILGTDKEYQVGGLFVFDLDGKIVQRISPIDRPNNVDVEVGFELGGKQVDLAVLTERGTKRLRVFAIDRTTGLLSDVSGKTDVFSDREGEQAAPMGIALYKRPTGGEIFAIVGSKEGPTEGYLHQYKLVSNGDRVDLEFVRAFGAFSGNGEIEAIAVDDEIGTVYYADEAYGLRKYPADPEDTDANVLLAEMGLEGYEGDREGIGIAKVGGPGQGFVLSVDQIAGGSKVNVYVRERADAKPITVIPTPADDTDGLEVTTTPLGDKYPNGIVVMMSSKDKAFMIFDWNMFAESISQNR